MRKTACLEGRLPRLALARRSPSSLRTLRVCTRRRIAHKTWATRNRASRLTLGRRTSHPFVVELPAPPARVHRPGPAPRDRERDQPSRGSERRLPDRPPDLLSGGQDLRAL